MKKTYLIIGIILIALMGVAFYQEMVPKTVTMTVDKYEVDDTVGEEIPETQNQPELVETIEMEVPVEEIEAVQESEIREEFVPESFTIGEQAGALSDMSHTFSFNEQDLRLEEEIGYYYYDRLGENGKRVYRQILAGLKNMLETFDVNLSSEDAWTYFRMVMNDHPELFWVNTSYTYWDYQDFVKIEPQYNRNEKEKKRDQKKLDKAVEKALKNAPKNGKVYDRIKYVFKYV